MERTITIIQTIFGFGVLGCAGGFERGGHMITAIALAFAFCIAIYALQRMKERLAVRTRKKAVRVRIPDDERRWAA